MIEDLEPRIAAPILDAIGMAQISTNDIDLVVLMGAGTRVPKVKEILKTILKDKVILKTFKYFLNSRLKNDKCCRKSAIS